MLEDDYKDDYYVVFEEKNDFSEEKYQLSNMNPAAWKFSKMRPSNFSYCAYSTAFGCDDSSKTNILNHFTD